MLPVDTDFALRRTRSRSAARPVLLALAFVAATVCLAQDQAKPKISNSPLTAEQLSIYRAVLGHWMEHDLSSLNLSIQTVPLQSSGPFSDEGCAKGLDLEPSPTAIVHRFRPQDIAQLAPGRTITLVDPDRQRREVHDNDPEKTVGEGSSIEDAVRNGFAHGLVTLSEIRFDKKHQQAIVSYGFFCGSLCGNGGTVVLEKAESGWHRRKNCSDWISRLTPVSEPPVRAISA